MRLPTPSATGINCPDSTMNQRRQRLLQTMALQVSSRPPASADAHSIRELAPFPVREPVSGRAYTVIRLKSQSGLSGYGECGRVSAAQIEAARTVVTGRPATTWGVT